MPKRMSLPRELIVDQTFDLERLPPWMENAECYSRIGSDVVIQSKKIPIAIARFEKGADLITCDCQRARESGRCDHQQALANGLWARLTALPLDESLLTCTQDWCTYVLSSPSHLFASVETQAVYA